MDFGILSSFTTFTSHHFKQPLNTEERITLHQDAETTLKKLEVAHSLHKVLIAQLLETNALLTSINARNSVHNDMEDIEVDPLNQLEELRRGCSPLAGRLATLQTFLHIARRYQLVLVRDLLQLKASLGIALQPELWTNLDTAVRMVTEDPPNVHDLYLWSSRTTEQQTREPMRENVALWRP